MRLGPTEKGAPGQRPANRAESRQAALLPKTGLTPLQALAKSRVRAMLTLFPADPRAFPQRAKEVVRRSFAVRFPFNRKTASITHGTATAYNQLHWRSREMGQFVTTMDRSLIQTLQLTADHRLAEKCLDYYLQTIRGQRKIPELYVDEAARKMSTALSDFLHTGASRKVEFALTQGRLAEKGGLTEREADELARKFADYAGVREAQTEKPGFGLMLLHLISHGHSTEAADRNITTGAHDAEIRKMLEEHWPQHEIQTREFGKAMGRIDHQQIEGILEGAERTPQNSKSRAKGLKARVTEALDETIGKTPFERLEERLEKIAEAEELKKEHSESFLHIWHEEHYEDQANRHARLYRHEFGRLAKKAGGDAQIAQMAATWLKRRPDETVQLRFIEMLPKDKFPLTAYSFFEHGTREAVKKAVEYLGRAQRPK